AHAVPLRPLSPVQHRADGHARMAGDPLWRWRISRRVGKPSKRLPTKGAPVARIHHRIRDQAGPETYRCRTAPPQASPHRPMLLAIDTSTHYASVDLHDGERLLSEHTWLANQDHTRTLLPNIQQLLADSRAEMSRVSAVAV